MMHEFTKISRMDDEFVRVELAEYRDSNVALFTHWDEKYDALARMVLPNWAEYCRKHKYFLRGYINYHEDPARPETYGDKGKFRYYTDLRGHFKYVMFLDIDCLFMNMDIKIEHQMDDYADRPWESDLHSQRPFMWTYDDNGPLSGLWIATTHERTERHLRHAYEYAARENNVRHGKIEPNGISDQDAMTRLMHIPPFSTTFGHCLPAKFMGHCYESNYELGDWIITFPGVSLEEKTALLKEWLQRVGTV